jgi:hypothetical protein
MRVPLVEVDIGLLADQVGVAASNTLDLGQGVHDLLLSIDVRVEETKDELEVRLFTADERPASERNRQNLLRFPITNCSCVGRDSHVGRSLVSPGCRVVVCRLSYTVVGSCCWRAFR